MFENEKKVKTLITNKQQINLDDKIEDLKQMFADKQAFSSLEDRVSTVECDQKKQLNQI